jgi:hypothetical protein
MARAFRSLLTFALLAAAIGLSAAASGSAASAPRWVVHVKSFSGGISNGVRARLAAVDAGGGSTSTLALQPSGAAAPQVATATLQNVQMNTDCDPPLPQDETSVAFNLTDPMNAVAAANDFCGDGYWMGFTTDGGQTWGSIFKDPKTSNGERCFGSDPSVIYSQRDDAFYVSTLCFFSTSPISEVQVWKSTDDGATWTDSTKASIAITNRAADGSIDGSVFYDKELLAVDNNPAGAHFGRIYVTFIKFHMPGGNARVDTCPVQLAFTDDIPTADPRTATWSHTAVVPDAPESGGIGASANQWALPVVDSTGALNVSYMSEDCNTAYDRAIFFTRSTNGGSSFQAPVRIDKPGQFADNPNRQDKLPAKSPRLPISPSMAFDPTRNRLVYIYQNNVNRTVSGADISLQTSNDFGATWSNATAISITGAGTAAPGDQFFPWIAVDESGRYHAIWFDTRDDPANRLIETFQALSTDGGATWTNTNISTVSWDPHDGFFSNGAFIGDYNGLAASDEVVYPVWTDGRTSAGPPLGQTDIFTNVEIAD